MSKNLLFNLFAAAIFVMSLASCTTYSHSYRLASTEQESSFQVNSGYVADLKMDFKKKIAATSGKHKTPKLAKEEAYYNAIMENNIHVVIDPIYKVKTTFSILAGQRASAEITGFAGYYENVRSSSESTNTNNAAMLAQEQAIFDMRFKNLEKLATLDGVAKEEKNSYVVDSRGGCCDGTKGKEGYGDVHMIHSAKNQESILDQYTKMVYGSQDVEGNVSTIAFGAAVIDEAIVQQDNIFKKILKKIPIVKKFIK